MGAKVVSDCLLQARAERSSSSVPQGGTLVFRSLGLTKVEEKKDRSGPCC